MSPMLLRVFAPPYDEPLSSVVRPRDDHPPSGFGEGVLDRDICEVGSRVGVEGIGVSEPANGRGWLPKAVPVVGEVCWLGSAALSSAAVGKDVPEGRRRGWPVDVATVASFVEKDKCMQEDSFVLEEGV